MNNNIYYLDQRKYKRKEFNKTKRIYLFFFLIIFLLIMGIFLLTREDTRPVLVQYGQIVDGFKTKALVIRKERVQFSPQSGNVFLKQIEGERISYGQKVVQLQNSKGNLTLFNYQPGIISYATDGLEKVLDPENLDKITIEKFDHIKRKYRQLVNGKYLKKGQPIYRLIDNNSLYIIIKTEAKEVERYRLNELVFIKTVGLDKDLIDGRIVHKTITGEKGLLVIKLNRFIREWLNLRWVEIDFIKNIYRGIIIPRQAIFTQPEGEGVLICTSNGKYKFKKIKVLEKNREKAVVSGLKIGDCILENPAIVNYGEGAK